ncbi:MAG: hypothetical protein [Caudoviricetes sp.]|nr:MAG: hypothetical protein [Caudoviricetes sp.]
MTKSESDIQSLILIYVTSLPESFAFRMNTGVSNNDGRFTRYGIPGQPDIFMIYRGRFIGVEVKTKTGRQSEKQKQWQRNCERAGGIYILARSVDDVRDRLMSEGLL